MVERTVRDREVGSSNLPTPTISKNQQAEYVVTLPQCHSELDHSFRPSLFARLLHGFAVIVLICCSLLSCRAESSDTPLRIGLAKYLKGASAIQVSCSVDYIISDEGGQQTRMTSAYLEPIDVSIARDCIQVKKADGKTVTIGNVLRISPESSDGLLTISTPTRSFSQYRGILEIRRVTDTALQVVNELPLEDYLKGVLPAEMPSTFHFEALKAQAIAARTYSEKHRGRHKDSGYDMCDNDHCQVYLGSAGESPRTSKAVSETAGMVAMYDGDLIMAVYSADCGGQTQSGDDQAIGQPEPYLKSVPDCASGGKQDLCSTNRTHEWTKTYTPQELEAALNVRLHPPVQGLKSVTFVGYDDSGRVKQVDLVDDKGTRSMTGVEFRRNCGYTAIRSLRMTVSATQDGKICFAGKGWGHGVGLCQWGAEALARDPLRYKCADILNHYYPGVTIAKLPEGSAAGRHAVVSLNDFMRRLFLTWRGKRR